VPTLKETRHGQAVVVSGALHVGHAGMVVARSQGVAAARKAPVSAWPRWQLAVTVTEGSGTVSGTA
jgi:hypothetical protein